MPDRPKLTRYFHPAPPDLSRTRPMHCRHPGHRHSIYCLIPPYVLDSIARNGTPQQRADALRTRSFDHTFRTLRVANMPARVRSAVPTVPVGGVLTPRRSIYSANHAETLPGTLVRSEGDAPSDDVAVNEAYDGLGATFDFFAQAYDRNSIDDAGLPLKATVHFGQAYDNAFWNSEQMVFGDGDGQLFNRFTISLDVIGHELSHGVTEDEAQLQYLNQSGALNESMSDVFGSLIKQWARGQTAEDADWLIGDGLLADGVQGVALRSMKAPGTAFDDPVLGRDPQPGHMDDYVQTYQDNGGVHINSGIPNRAFYEVAIRLGGAAWERAGRLWYESLRDSRVRPNTGFLAFARVTQTLAVKIYGAGSEEEGAIRDGWGAVGITI